MVHTGTFYNTRGYSSSDPRLSFAEWLTGPWCGLFEFPQVHDRVFYTKNVTVLRLGEWFELTVFY